MAVPTEDTRTDVKASSVPWAELHDGNLHYDRSCFPVVRPAKWAWSDVSAYLDELAEDPTREEAEDRFVSLVNADTATLGTTPGMFISIGVIKPGETLAKHRHTAAAMYYFVRGEGFSMINGERIDWVAGDVIACPAWSWHEHTCTSDEYAIQLVIQDMNMHTALQTMIFEPGDGSQQHAVTQRD